MTREQANNLHKGQLLYFPGQLGKSISEAWGIFESIEEQLPDSMTLSVEWTWQGGPTLLRMSPSNMNSISLYQIAKEEDLWHLIEVIFEAVRFR